MLDGTGVQWKARPASAGERGEAVTWTVIHGDCLAVIPTLPVETRRIVAADPPYGYGHYKTDRDVTAQMLAAVAGWKTLALKGYAQDLHRWLAGVEVTEWVCWYPTNYATKAGGRWSPLPRWHEDWAVCGECPGAQRLVRPKINPTIMCRDKTGKCHQKDGYDPKAPARVGDVWTERAPGVAFEGPRRLHPNETALGVQLKLVELISNPGDTILDPFAGSFSLGVAAIRLGRSYIGIEVDAAWAEQGRERMQAEQEGSTLQARRAGQIALFGGRE